MNEIARRLRQMASDPNTQQALAVLRENFSDFDGLGPMRVAEFLTDGPSDDIQADAQAIVLDLLEQFEGS